MTVPKIAILWYFPNNKAMGLPELFSSMEGKLTVDMLFNGRFGIFLFR